MKINDLYRRKRIKSKFQSNEHCTFISIDEENYQNHKLFIAKVNSHEEDLRYNEIISLNNDEAYLVELCIFFITKSVSNNDLVVINDEYDIYVEILNTKDFFINYFNEKDTFDLALYNKTHNLSLSISEEEYEIKFYLAKW